MASDAAFMDKLTALCKRRGFIFQSSEIYGGIGGFWDYGPLGVELKRNIKEAWWRDFVMNPPLGPDGREIQMVGLDCSIIMNPKVWEASGHATGFADLMRGCEVCKKIFREDQVEAQLAESDWYRELCDLWVSGDNVPINGLRRWAEKRGSRAPGLALVVDTESVLAKLQGLANESNEPQAQRAFSNFVFGASGDVWMSDVCPNCGGVLSESRQFNLMFDTHAGALRDSASKVYLRPETAQGIFCNFKNVLDTSRVKIPFGIAQIGKAFRNEITPRNYIFRSREFEQMEIEFFCREEESMDWYQFWRNHRFNWYVGLGLKSEKLRLRDQTKEELAHYSKACADIEYLFPFSDEHQELEGVAHRGNFDLTQHQTHSGKDLTYFEETKWSEFLADRKAKGMPELTKDEKSDLGSKPPYRYLPTVIEPSAGADRATLAFLCEAYTEDQKPDAKGVMQTRVYMKFHPRLAPIKAAFFPLVNKEGMPELAEKLYRDAKKHMNVFYDDGGSIGKRYARMDEAGTPFCITIDGDTIKSDGENAGMVTVRDRDTLEQIRVHCDKVTAWLRERMGQA